MEKDPTRIETQIVPFEQARFLDRLDDEHEDMWGTIRDLTPESAPHFVYIDMWNDHELPRVFRDRALLALVGTKNARKKLGIDEMYASGNLGGGGDWGLIEQKKHEIKTTPEYLQWTMDVAKYQYVANPQEDGSYNFDLEWEKRLVDPSGLLPFWCCAFRDDRVTENEFETCLSYIKVGSAMPDEAWPKPKPGEKRVLFSMADDGIPLDMNRFPLVDDMLLTPEVYGESDKLKTWALEKLQQWLEHKRDGAEVPTWLQEIYEHQVKRTTERIKDELIGRNKAGLSWESILPVIDYLGWDDLLNWQSWDGGKKYARPTVYRATPILDSLPTVEDRTKLLRYIFDHRQELEKIHDNERPMLDEHNDSKRVFKQVADESNDAEIIGWVDQELEAIDTWYTTRREHTAQHEQESIQRRLNEQKQAVETARQNEINAQKLKGLLNVIKAVSD